ncbi:unnamed protein product [Ixodes pacificus]
MLPDAWIELLPLVALDRCTDGGFFRRCLFCVRVFTDVVVFIPVLWELGGSVVRRLCSIVVHRSSVRPFWRVVWRLRCSGLYSFLCLGCVHEHLRLILLLAVSSDGSIRGHAFLRRMSEKVAVGAAGNATFSSDVPGSSAAQAQWSSPRHQDQDSASLQSHFVGNFVDRHTLMKSHLHETRVLLDIFKTLFSEALPGYTGHLPELLQLLLHFEV